MSPAFRWLIVLSYCVAASAQTEQAPASVVAGIPVNYDESKVGTYTLPDPLVLADGKPAKDVKTWTEKRRPEIVRLFEENQYGRARPPCRNDLRSLRQRNPRLRWQSDPQADHCTLFLSNKAASNEAASNKAASNKAASNKAASNMAASNMAASNMDGPKMDLLLYLPANAQKPVPFLLNASFSANSNTVDDPGVRVGEVWGPDKKKIPANQGRRFGKIDVVRLLDAGFGFGTVYYGDIDPDFLGGTPNGVRAQFLKPGQTEPAPDEWGTISAWAWGLSRAMDYLETDKGVDAKRVRTESGHALGGDVGRRARPALRHGDRQLLGRRRRSPQPQELRRDHRPLPPPPLATPISSPPTTASSSTGRQFRPTRTLVRALIAPRPFFSINRRQVISGQTRKANFAAGRPVVHRLRAAALPRSMRRQWQSGISP